jgi:hypothetical protein
MLYQSANVKERAVTYRKYFLGGAIPMGQIPTLIPLWNYAVGATKAADEGWMSSVNKPTTADLSARATHMWTLADRVATGLARLKLLDYNRAGEEKRHALLNMHLLQAGMEIRPSMELDKLQEMFDGEVPPAIQVAADLPPRGQRPRC